MKFILLILTSLLITISSFSQKSVTQRVKEIYTAIQKGKIKPIFIASQNEPFWDIYIMGNYAIFHSDQGQSYDYFTVQENFDKNKYSQVLHLKDGSGNISTLKITLQGSTWNENTNIKTWGKEYDTTYTIYNYNEKSLKNEIKMIDKNNELIRLEKFEYKFFKNSAK